MQSTSFKSRGNARRKTRPGFGKSGNQKKGQGKKIDINKYVNASKSLAEQKPYEAVNSFEDFMLDNEILSRVTKKGYKNPSEIQDKAIALALDGRDIIGVAGTGTGKTAAFLIPIIQQILEDKQKNHALIIAPTRELANQINDEFISLTRGLGIFSTCLIGGSSVRESIKSLKRTNHIVIGTPGRLMDMHKQGHLPFSAFNVLVLDEFDRMLDMGFKQEMQIINTKMVQKSQTLLFSATVDPSQRQVIKEIAGDAIEIKAKAHTQITSSIQQEVMRVTNGNRFDLLHDILVGGDKAILFCETKRKADKIQKQLGASSIPAEAIHGDKSQKAREIALRKFRKGFVNVLVATDVVARGIDVKDVDVVINYETPRNYEDYVHRIGRTGRAGKTGRAITLVD